MTPEGIAMVVGLFIVVDVAKDTASYLIQKGLGKNGRCNGGKHCADHPSIVETLNKLIGQYEDEKQIELYTEAIKRANGSMYRTDARD